jgi:hypothetical protein
MNRRSKSPLLAPAHGLLHLVTASLQLPLKGPNDAEVFEAYVENQTPGAYRFFWCYGPDQAELTILAITLHP